MIDMELKLTENQYQALFDMVDFYRDFQNDLYDSPAVETLFTETQRELFEIFQLDA